MVLPACGGDAGGDSSGSGSGSSEPWKIGGNFMLTGALGPLGQAWEAGVNVAFDEVNADGGVHDRQLELTSLDDENANPAKAAANYKSLATSDKVLAVVGVPNSVTAGAIQPLTEQLKVPVIGTGFGPPYTDYTFSSGLDPYASLLNMIPLIQHLAEAEGLDEPKVATISADTASGQKSTELYKEAAADAGLNNVIDRNDPPTLTQYSTEAAAIMQADPDIVGISEPTAVAVIVVRALRQAGFEGDIVGGYFTASEQTFQQIDDPRFYAYRDFADPSTEVAADLVATADKFGVDAKSFVAGQYFTTGYVIGKMVAAVLDECGESCTPESFTKALTSGAANIDTGGLTGKAGYDGDNHSFLQEVSNYKWDQAAKTSVPFEDLPTSEASYTG
jgi:branched-chain amino acid transport system substrate-binding protein